MIEEYLKSIESNNEELYGGMLSELEEEVPKELHEDIMRTLRERAPKMRNHNFKRYASIAAGLVVILLSLNIISSRFNFRVELSQDRSEMSIPQENSKLSPNQGKGYLEDRDSENGGLSEGDRISDNSMPYNKVILKTTDIDLIDFIEDNGVLKEEGVYILDLEKYKGLSDMIKERNDNVSVYYPESDKDFFMNAKNKIEFILVELVKE